MDAGYSGTPLVRKLGIKPDSRVMICPGIDDIEEHLEPFIKAESSLDVVIAPVTTVDELVLALDLKNKIKLNGAIWVCWPKRTSKIPSELTEDTLREYGLPLGLVDNKVCAIDQDWSGLRFVWRKELRGNQPQ